MAYKPIQPLEGDYESSWTRSLDEAAERWRDVRNEVEGTPAYQAFLDRLQSEWAIEAGLVERLYTWDRGVTQVLLARGVDAETIAREARQTAEQARKAAALIRDQRDVVEGLFQHVKGERELSESYIRELHSALTQNQPTTAALSPGGELIDVPLLRGTYKTSPNNPSRDGVVVHVYCPPEQTAPEMERLIELYDGLPAGTQPIVAAAWLHHRFTQIHPFMDGNGRVARALASLVTVKAGLLPVVVRNVDRAQYIEALESADDGDLGPLVDHFASTLASDLEAACRLATTHSDERRPDVLGGMDLTPPRATDQQQKRERRKEVAQRATDDLQGSIVREFRSSCEAIEERIRSLPGASQRIVDTVLAESIPNSVFVHEAHLRTSVPGLLADTLRVDSHVHWGVLVDRWFYVVLIVRRSRKDELRTVASLHWLEFDAEDPSAKRGMFPVGGGDLGNAVWQSSGGSVSAETGAASRWLEEGLELAMERWRRSLES